MRTCVQVEITYLIQLNPLIVSMTMISEKLLIIGNHC